MSMETIYRLLYCIVKPFFCLCHPVRSVGRENIPEGAVVLCANHDRGALTRKACTAGCIGCMKCEKSCPEDAIHVHNNVARVDYDKCTGCRTCMNVCPVHAITIPKIV